MKRNEPKKNQENLNASTHMPTLGPPDFQANTLSINVLKNKSALRFFSSPFTPSKSLPAAGRGDIEIRI